MCSQREAFSRVGKKARAKVNSFGSEIQIGVTIEDVHVGAFGVVHYKCKVNDGQGILTVTEPFLVLS